MKYAIMLGGSYWNGISFWDKNKAVLFATEEYAKYCMDMFLMERNPKDEEDYEYNSQLKVVECI